MYSRVAQRLDGVLHRAEIGDPSCGHVSFDVHTDRYILFSDLHRGARTAADEFQGAERAYRAALAYYLELGYTLVVLGDAEELWEERAAAVLASYGETFELEAEFHRRRRYLRIWGNHDDEWQYPAGVGRLLAPVYGSPRLQIYEGILVEMTEGDRTLGRLFLVHGHQGDARSDRWAWASKLVIRYLWRPYQRLTRARINTPATSWGLRDKLNRAMYAWAETQGKLVLIAGHTHHPVFRSMSHEARIRARLAELEAAAGDPMLPSERLEIAYLRAQFQWVRTSNQGSQRQPEGISFDTPCYFNTGCCCYDDGDITGLEIADGEIRLVRWPDDYGEPRPHVLDRDRLDAVLAAC